LLLVSTGEDDGQETHWLKPGPLQVAQSGWHCVQTPLELNVLFGQVETQEPLNTMPLAQDVQKSALPEHVLQLELQVLQTPFEANDPDGQESAHLPPVKTLPGKQAVHFT
jgi:hypothetical protein